MSAVPQSDTWSYTRSDRHTRTCLELASRPASEGLSCRWPCLSSGMHATVQSRCSSVVRSGTSSAVQSVGASCGDGCSPVPLKVHDDSPTRSRAAAPSPANRRRPSLLACVGEPPLTSLTPARAASPDVLGHASRGSGGREDDFVVARGERRPVGSRPDEVSISCALGLPVRAAHPRACGRHEPAPRSLLWPGTPGIR